MVYNNKLCHPFPGTCSLSYTAILGLLSRSIGISPKSLGQACSDLLYLTLHIIQAPSLQLCGIVDIQTTGPAC